MKPIYLAALTAAVALQTGCAMFSGTNRTLHPSELNTELRDLDGDKVNPFAQQGPSKVEYLEVGIPEYDKFFKSSAELQGTMVIGDLLVKDMQNEVKKAKEAVLPTGDVATSAAGAAIHAATNKGQVLSDSQKQVLQHALDRAKVTGALLAEVPGKALELVGQARNLVTSTPHSFTGINALKAPAVTQGLNDAIKRLQNAAERAPKLATSLKDQTQEAVALVTGPAPANAEASVDTSAMPGLDLSSAAPKKAAKASKKGKKNVAAAAPKKKTRG